MKKLTSYYLVTLLLLLGLCIINDYKSALALIGVASLFIAALTAFEDNNDILSLNLAEFLCKKFLPMTLVSYLYPFLLYIAYFYGALEEHINFNLIAANLLYLPIELLVVIKGVGDNCVSLPFESHTEKRIVK